MSEPVQGEIVAAAPVLEITLKEPVQFGPQLVTVLRFRQPNAGHLRGIYWGAIEGQVLPGPYLEVASKLTGLPPAFFDALTPPNMWQVVFATMPLVSPSGATGEKL